MLLNRHYVLELSGVIAIANLDPEDNYKTIAILAKEATIAIAQTSAPNNVDDNGRRTS